MAKQEVWEKKRSKWGLLGYLLAILFLGYIAYSVYYYLTNTEKVDEFEVCAEGQCVKTFHAHAKLNIELCGEEMNLQKEKGILSGPHTHKEKNMLHFHERLPYDKKTKELLNITPFLIETFMNEMDIVFNERCISEYCNGRKCPDGSEGTVRMFVNEKPNTEFDNYMWKDDDEILIKFS